MYHPYLVYLRKEVRLNRGNSKYHVCTSLVGGPRTVRLGISYFRSGVVGRIDVWTGTLLVPL
jgi:hypothetical protein